PRGTGLDLAPCGSRLALDGRAQRQPMVSDDAALPAKANRHLGQCAGGGAGGAARRLASLAGPWRPLGFEPAGRLAAGGLQHLGLERIFDRGLVEIPGNIDDNAARAAIVKQRGTQAPGAMRVQEVLPPAPLYDLRDQHSDQPIRMLTVQRLDQLEQGHRPGGTALGAARAWAEET